MWVPNCIWQVTTQTCLLLHLYYEFDQVDSVTRWVYYQLKLSSFTHQVSQIPGDDTHAILPSSLCSVHSIVMFREINTIELERITWTSNSLPSCPLRINVEYSCDGFVNSIYFNFVVIVSQLLINSREIFEQLHWAGRLLFSPPVPQQYSQLDN